MIIIKLKINDKIKDVYGNNFCYHGHLHFLKRFNNSLTIMSVFNSDTKMVDNKSKHHIPKAI